MEKVEYLNKFQKMEITVLNTHYEGGNCTVTFRYWKTGECACTAQRAKRTFPHEPTKQDLINAI